MLRIGRADEMIRRDVQQRPRVAEGGGNPVGILTRGYALFLRRLDDLLAVFVRAGLKAHVIAAEPPETAVGVGNDGGVGVADVRRGINVVNRGGDVGGHGWKIMEEQVIESRLSVLLCINETYFTYRSNWCLVEALQLNSVKFSRNYLFHLCARNYFLRRFK